MAVPAAMPDARVAGKVPFEAAVRLVDQRLSDVFGTGFERLSAGRIRAAYPARRFVDGWRMPVECPDGEVRRFDLLITAAFPSGYPRTALVDRPDYLEWPHIERDGVLCLLPIGAEVDPEDPAGVATNLLGRSARLLGELIEGKIVDRDFKEEFLTYWFYGSDPDAPLVRSLVRPRGPSRMVRVWRDRDGSMVVAENGDQLSSWLDNWRGLPAGRKSHHHEPAALIWLEDPMLPSAYPVVGSDVQGIARLAGEDASLALQALASTTTGDGVVLIGALGRCGPGLVAVTTNVAERGKGWRSTVEHPMTKGFRHRPLPPGIAVDRMFSAEPVIRATVERADAAWIHGRGHDTRALDLLGRRVVVIGCGSLGSSVAARLARAGVGKMDLVDGERLAWSNVGRHELGADSVGLPKASALSAKLRRELPHLDVDGHATTAHHFMIARPELMEHADLIVCATGSWDAESAVNRWQLDRDRVVPVLYGWLEDRVLAAHALDIGASGGCLACGFGPTGTPVFSAVEWPAGRPVAEEPACGNHYQPYGAVELGAAVDLVSRAAVDRLVGHEGGTRHRVWLAPSRSVDEAGAAWSADLAALAPSHLHGATQVELEWPVQCDLCARGKRAAETTTKAMAIQR